MEENRNAWKMFKIIILVLLVLPEKRYVYFSPIIIRYSLEYLHCGSFRNLIFFIIIIYAKFSLLSQAMK